MVSDMEKVSCIERYLGFKCKAIEWRRAELWGLRWNACANRSTFSVVRYSSRATTWLLVDSGRSSLKLCNPIQYCLACRNLSIPPDVIMTSKTTLCYSSGVIVFKRNVSTANARRSSDELCTMSEGFNPLHPAMCVSPRQLQRCRHGAKFKSSICFCPTLYYLKYFLTFCSNVFSIL